MNKNNTMESEKPATEPEDGVLKSFKRYMEQDQETEITIAVIVILSAAFLFLVILSNLVIDPDPETVAIGLVPVIIALLISGKLALTEIQTPAGFKLLFDPLSKSESTDVMSDSIDFVAKNIIDLQNENIDTDENIKRLIDRIEQKETTILSFNLDREYKHELIDICMRAIINDKDGTVQYLLFTEDPNETFAGMLELSTTFRNGTIINLMDDITATSNGNAVNGWTFLMNREVLNKAGVITLGKSVSIENTRKQALRQMKETNHDWLPVTKDNKFVGVISHNHIVRDILLTETN